jgi:2-polyprenyl-3-methyl-5-hydroxy-6-metoxy-1,4-benzoquinol methylase
MSADYAVLAPIYEQIGMARFAETMTERLINLAQRGDWAGRRILELGCGTGASMVWLAQHGYFVTGVDNTALMLEIARARLAEDDRHADYTLHNRDVRALGGDLGSFDLVLALDVLNELNSLRDLEIVFKDVYAMLSPERLLIFDLHTIQGLAESGTSGDQMVHRSDDLVVFRSNQFDYERQIHEQHFTIFSRDQDVWLRSEAVRALRAFPAQAVASLLQRSGFTTTTVLTTRFEPFDPNTAQAERVIFIVEKH